MKTRKTRLKAGLLMIALIIVMFLYAPASAAKKASLSNSKLNVPVGQTKKLTVKNATKTVKWKILSGKKYISTKKSGKNSLIIKGEKKGTAKIRATVGKKKLACTVTVKKASKKFTPKTEVTELPKPTVIPGEQPKQTVTPTGQPEITAGPTQKPTEEPTATPTERPTEEPIATPSERPTEKPTQRPTEQPTAIPTQRPAVKICDYDFNDGQLGDVYGNDARLEIVEGLNSTYNGASGTDGSCVKVTDRKGGWWEREAFAYKIDKLEVGKKYVISFDARHENGVAEKYDSDNRVIIVHYMPDYGQIGQPAAVFNEDWEHVEWEFTLSEGYADKTGDKFIYLEFAYPEPIESYEYGYRDKNEEEYYIDNFCIKEYVEPIVLPKPTAKPSPTPYPKGIIYRQRYDVTRWFEPVSAAQAINGHSHDGYKNNNFAMWMVGFYDNAFSTDEAEYMTYGPDLTKVTNAEFINWHDFRGREELRVQGEISYEGTAQNTVFLQISYTSPSAYPILWKWEDGAEKAEQSNHQQELKVKNNLDKTYGNKALKPNETGKLDISFTIPANAQNGDKDENGNPYGIYLYFPSRPDGALAYKKDNTFHFKNFSITY